MKRSRPEVTLLLIDEQRSFMPPEFRIQLPTSGRTTALKEKENRPMKNVSFPKLVKWVLSGAVHPIALFRRVHACSDYLELANVKIYYAQFRHLYETEAHYDRHVTKVYQYLLWLPRQQRAFQKVMNTLTEHYGAFKFREPEIQNYDFGNFDAWNVDRTHPYKIPLTHINGVSRISSL